MPGYIRYYIRGFRRLPDGSFEEKIETVSSQSAEQALDIANKKRNRLYFDEGFSEGHVFIDRVGYSLPWDRASKRCVEPES